MTSRASGRRTATTSAATPGRRSAIGTTEPGRNARAGRLAARHGQADQAGDADGEVVPLRRAAVDAAPAGPALRRAADGSRRLSRAALVLDRLVATRQVGGRADDRPPGRRRSVP